MWAWQRSPRWDRRILEKNSQPTCSWRNWLAHIPGIIRHLTKKLWECQAFFCKQSRHRKNWFSNWKEHSIICWHNEDTSSSVEKTSTESWNAQIKLFQLWNNKGCSHYGIGVFNPRPKQKDLCTFNLPGKSCQIKKKDRLHYEDIYSSDTSEDGLVKTNC